MKKQLNTLMIAAAGLIALPALSAGTANFANASTGSTVSWYGPGFHGKLTASGERFNQNAMTCASNSHKMGTMLKVTNRANGKSVVCKVNDTGGFSKYGIKLDLSKAAFATIAPLGQGRAKVNIENVGFQKIKRAR